MEARCCLNVTWIWMMRENTRRPTLSTILCLIVLLGGAFCSNPHLSNAQAAEQPNILWLVSEDNSPLIGAYGDDFASTPNIDELASESFVYTSAYANAPVCAPSRNTIISGIYATSAGQQHQRSYNRKSDAVVLLPQYLREAGYYTTNNDKEDYNISLDQTRGIWDESSDKAHYRNRAEGQPFFAVFNNHQSHESTIHRLKPADELRHDPEDVTLPPYHPDTPAIRRDWAQYYDNIEDMDAWVGEMLDELEESGEADNTIVFYYGDHGGVLPRSKRFVYETGTRIPFMVRIPEKFKHLRPTGDPGSSVGRLIGLVDLAPTLLSIIGTPIPDEMQGHAFLGDQQTPAPEYAYMFRGRMDEKYDMSRAVRDEQYRYIRNYMPYRIYGQHLDYLWQAASMRSWEETCRLGDCNALQASHWKAKPAEELYDTANDPWEVNNLVDDPAYADALERMREVLSEWTLEIRDSGFIPEADLIRRAGDVPIYDYMRSGDVPLERIIEAAETATTATNDDLSVLTAYLQSDDSAIRYWGATGLLMAGDEAASAMEALRGALDDPSPNVVVVASEALYNLGEQTAAREGFMRVLQSTNPMARTHAMNAIEAVEDDSDEIRQEVIEFARAAGVMTRHNYDHRSAKRLLDLWSVDLAEHGIEAEW